MRVPRFIWSKSQGSLNPRLSQDLTLTGDNFHHLSHVLRLKVGQRLEVIDHDSGQLYCCSLKAIDAASAMARIEEAKILPSLPVITLLAGSTKPATCDFILEKSIEIGVTRVCFFAAKRSQEGNTRLAGRLGRFKRVIEGATKQSGGTATIGQVLLFSSLKEALGLLHSTPHEVAAPRAQRFLLKHSAPPLLNLIAVTYGKDSRIHGKGTNRQQIQGVASSALEQDWKNAESFLIVGPEGGLTDEEEEVANSYSYFAVSLGPKVLRSETAVLVGAALISLVTASES